MWRTITTAIAIGIFAVSPCFAETVPLLQIVEHPALNATRQGIADELKTAGITLKTESAQGNPALAAQIAQKFVGDAPKIMLALDTSAAQALMAANRHHTIPLVFSSVTDPVSAHLVANLQEPEGTVTGVSNFIDPSVHFALFKKILPHASKIGVIYNPGETNSTSLVTHMQKVARNTHMQLVLQTATNSADVSAATESLMGKVDAIFIDSDNTALSAFDTIVKTAVKQKIPVFSSDTDMVRHGALAALGPNQYEIGRQTGKMALKILLEGVKPRQIPVAFPTPQELELHLNPDMARRLGIVFSPELLKEAKRGSAPL